MFNSPCNVYIYGKICNFSRFVKQLSGVSVQVSVFIIVFGHITAGKTFWHVTSLSLTELPPKQILPGIIFQLGL